MNERSHALRKIAWIVVVALWVAVLAAGGALIYLNYFAPLPGAGLIPVV